MTEMEKLERAKMYIEKLAEGINPIDDRPAPEDDIINNVRLSRCFFYVADVLGKVIENGGTQTPAVKHYKDFYLTDEEKAILIPSKNSVSVTELTNMINEAKPEDFPSKLKVTAIGKWLAEIGMLEIITDEKGKNKKVPTYEGEQAGIIAEQRYNKNGMPYWAVLYGEKAQQFIFDNIDAVIEISNRREKKKKSHDSGKPWTVIQDECLKDLVRNGANVSEIALSLGHSERSVVARMKVLGLKI